MRSRSAADPTLLQEEDELMAKDKPKHEAKKPKKKVSKADPASRRTTSTVLPGQAPRS